jgi:hypothetical protein
VRLSYFFEKVSRDPLVHWKVQVSEFFGVQEMLLIDARTKYLVGVVKFPKHTVLVKGERER